MEKRIHVSAHASNVTLPKFLSTAQVATMLGVCQRSILRWSATGEFPAPSIERERCKRWRASIVEDWVREQESTGEFR